MTGATGVFSNLARVVGDAAEDVDLPLKDGDYVLTHSTGDLKSFVTFTVSGTGAPVGSKSNPGVVGKTADDSVVAYTNGIGGVVVEGEGDMRDFDPSGDPAPWGTDVTEVEIGGNVTGVGANAFKGSTSLTNVTVLANTPPTMGADAFSGCDAIETVNVPKGASDDYKAAPGWSDFADRIIEQGTPENPWKVGDGVTAYVDEDGALHVDGDGAMTDFSDDNPAPWTMFVPPVSSVEIGEDVTGVGANAFKGCSSLTNVTVKATVPPSLGEDAFSDCDSLENISVPWTTGDDYRGASGWEDYADKILEMPGSPENPWKVGTEGDPDGVVAWTDGDGTVYFKPPRSTVSRTGLETITNALGGTGFDIALVDADGAATNDVEMIVGASGQQYNTTLDDALASDDDSFTLYDVNGVPVSLPAGVAGQTLVVSNLTAGTEITPSSTLPGGAEYVLPLGAKVAIYVVPSDGYRLIDDGTNPIVIDEVTTKTTVDVSEIPTVKSLAEESAIGDSDVTWKIEDGELVIDGSGEMPDFDAANPAPWNEFADKITSVEIGEAVEHLGRAAFYACTGATSITLANEEGMVNLAAFVSPDGSETSFPENIYIIEDGAKAKAVRFEGDADEDYDSLDAAYAAGETDVAPLTLNNVKAGYVEGLEEIAGPAPRSEEMQQLLNEAIDAVLAATTAAEVDAAAEDKGFPVSVLAAKEAVEKAAGDPAKRSKSLQAAVDEALAAIDAAKTFEEVASVRAEALAAINELVGKLGELYPNGDGGVFVTPVKATAYEGVVLDASGAVSGTITVKLSKPSKKGVTKLTATVKLLSDGKSLSFKRKDVPTNVNGPLVVALEPSNKRAASHALAVVIEGDSLKGVFDDGTVDAARNVFKRKGDPKRDAVLPIAGVWTGAFTCDAGEIYFSAKLRKGGSASVKVVLPNGKKASVSSKIEVGDNVVAVPVTVSKAVKGVTMTFGFRLAFVAGGDAVTINVTPLETRDKSKTVLSSDAAELLAVGMQKVTSKEFKTYHVAVDPALEAALGPITKNNLRLASASGWISGSLKFGKVSGNASGVVVNGAGIGKVSVKINRVKYDYQFVVAP